MKRFFQDTQQSSSDTAFPFNIPGTQRSVRAPAPSSDAFPFTLPDGIRAVQLPPPQPEPLPPSKQISCKSVLERLAITPEQSAAISAIPQGTQPWLDARKNRLTASNFGAAVGMNRYKSPRGLVKDMLWNTFKGNQATRWGSEHEDIARDAYVAKMQADIDAGVGPYTSIRVEETGLHVNPERPWLGSSPDGVVHVTTRDGGAHKFLLEIKCPFRKQFYQPPVPVYYNCQIQGVMANMDLPYCDFVVWIPGDLQITRVDFDTEFWNSTLFPKLDSFYHTMYLPAAVAKHNGLLGQGEIDVPLEL